MRNTNPNLRRHCLLLAVAAQFLFAFALQSADTKAKAAKAPVKFGDEYVGSATCQACHEDIYNNFLKSPHKASETDKTSAWKEPWLRIVPRSGSQTCGFGFGRRYQEPRETGCPANRPYLSRMPSESDDSFRPDSEQPYEGFCFLRCMPHGACERARRPGCKIPRAGK